MLDLFEVYEGWQYVKERRGQIAYLNFLGYTIEEIQNYVHLAYNTIVDYIRTYGIKLLEWAKTRFKVTKRKIKAFFKGEQTITWDCKKPEGKLFTYIIEHYDSEGKFVWLKVGQTKVGEKRFWQHLDERPYLLQNVTYIKVKKVFEFTEYEKSKIMESFLKLHYQKDPKNEYIKEDRFKSIMFTEKDLKDDEELQKRIEVIM